MKKEMRYWRLSNGAYLRTVEDLSAVPGVVEVSRDEALPYLLANGLGAS
jgi:hypothetical protein